jgi:hypothetical protein
VDRCVGVFAGDRADCDMNPKQFGFWLLFRYNGSLLSILTDNRRKSKSPELDVVP